MGLDSVKERDKESKADKNQIKDCRLKRERKDKIPTSCYGGLSLSFLSLNLFYFML